MDQFSKHVQEALKQIIEKSGISDHKIKVSLVSKKGENYLGILYRILIIGYKNNVETKLYLICKVPPLNRKSDDKTRINIPYQREVYIYNTVLKAYENLQNQKSILYKQKFTSYALCYAASDVDGKEFIILEDLHTKKFVMYDKNVKMDKKHVALVVQGLAKYHALSFVMKDQKPEAFRKMTHIDSKMYDIIGRKEFFDLCHFGLKQVLEALEKVGTTNLHKKVKLLKNNIEEFMENCYNAKGSEDYRVLTHGDCWNNNMMFKYQDDEPVEICFIDWQISRYVSPVLDLVYFFYLSTEGAILNNYFESFLQLYYEQLQNTTELLGSDLNVLYPYEIFQEDLKKFGNYGLVLCSFALNFTMANTETAPDFETLGESTSLENSIGFKDMAVKKIYEERIRDVVKHCAERNYI